jgi:hypothetical protein
MTRRRGAVIGILVLLGCGAVMLVRSSNRPATDATVQSLRTRALQCDASGDHATAVALYRAAADQGDGVAQAYLAIMYRRGDGVPRDRVQAMRWDAAVVLSCIRKRMDWMSLASLLLAAAGLISLVPRWKFPAWLAYALMAGATGFYDLHAICVPRWTCGNRTVAIAIFSTFSLACAVIAAGAGKEEGRGQRAGG